MGGFFYFSNMKKFSLLVGTALCLLSCSSQDDAFCNCLSATESLNNYTEKLMSKQATAEEAEKVKELRNEKDKACKAYETMDGPTMLKKKEACEQ